MSEVIDVGIKVPPGATKVVEVEAERIAAIIARVTHVRERLAVRAANEIIDYLISVHSAASTTQ